jgi:hypothetical protein
MTTPWSQLADRNDWITTYSGLPFFPLAPRECDVRIADIAHALSLLCRYTGHVVQFYSVAQHAVLVSQVGDPRFALRKLLHDGSEAYLNDLSRPVKHSPFLGGYRNIERPVQVVVYQAFGLSGDDAQADPEVKHCDDLVGRTERRDLVAMPDGWSPRGDVLPDRIVPVAPYLAEQQFLRRFAELGGRA